MLKKVFLVSTILIGGMVQAMGPSVNYDEQFDREEQASIKADIAQRLLMLKLESLVFQEEIKVDKNGKKVKKNLPVTHVIEGTKVVYINRVINSDTEDKRDIVVKNPIPKGTEYVIGSAVCAAGCTISYSTDGGASFSTEEQEGKVYTNLEFHFTTIPAQKEMRMGFRAIVK